ncbi:Tim44/TimA family putative adaptor protein [Mesorhizobium sp. INR15]|uniref:Tim44/TimA family putative adaptor protein n=1 Tax=Mesorhizobium sp. INR15 TaxID=2654248 RepID=UPI0018965279|nr:Tim44/TimA family putative adaptor protein [Mesorhizobium sp. INR15]QPC92990.1 Tim44/TimA family putative adaptor protein [Mesorhizobium sp. INR15]
MDETTNPNNHILILAIIAFYWALMGSWGQRQPRSGDDKAKQKDAQTDQPAGRVEGISSPDAPLNATQVIDPDFDPAKFLAGAKTAYEIILRAYADNDFQALKRLVGPEVLEVFERANADRRNREERLQLTFISTSEARVVSVLKECGAIEIVVRFVSDVVSVTRSANGAIVAGDPHQIDEVIDAWTFACDARSQKRNWILIATDSG